VKNIIPSISGPLSEIVNLSLCTGVVPDKMKTAKVIPLFKSGDNNVYKNYRPVSVLPSLSKIIVKMVYYRLIDYINKFDILNSNQYGFRQLHSTSMAILDFVEKIHTAADKREYSIGVFFRFSKSL